MKYLSILFAVVLFSANVFAGGSTVLKDTRHWFGATGGSKTVAVGYAWNVNPVLGGEQEVCQPCHSPHQKLNPGAEYLWNHSATTATFTRTLGSTAAIDYVGGIYLDPKERL